MNDTQEKAPPQTKTKELGRLTLQILVPEDLGETAGKMALKDLQPILRNVEAKLRKQVNNWPEEYGLGFTGSKLEVW